MKIAGILGTKRFMKQKKLLDTYAFLPYENA